MKHKNLSENSKYINILKILMIYLAFIYKFFIKLITIVKNVKTIIKETNFTIIKNNIFINFYHL